MVYKSLCMKLFYLIPLLLSFNSFSQRIYPPTFAVSDIYFETAKIQYWNNTKKVGPETFKTSSVFISNAKGKNPSITIDIPDVLYFKDGENYSTNYKLEDSGEETITYTFVKKNEFIGITFYYNEFSEKPYSMLINYKKNILNKSESSKLYQLLEIKE